MLLYLRRQYDLHRRRRGDHHAGWVLSHPPGELHEYENGAVRPLLFRVRYGADKCDRRNEWLSNPEFDRCDIDDKNFGG